MNKIMLIGRLTRNPENRVTPGGKKTASFTLAVDRPFRGKNGEKETDFIPVVAWGKLAELVGTYLKKGSLAAVTGRLQVRTYEKNGEKRTITEVVADEVQFLERKKEEREDLFSDVEDVRDSDIPF